MITVKKGSSRIAFITSGYVFKFARLRFFWRTLRDILVYGIQFKFKRLRHETKYNWIWFMRSLNANRSEYRCWKETHAHFLVPTLFSFGFLNVQKFEEGVIPSTDEMILLISKIGKVSKQHIYCIDPHQMEPKNFVKNDRGYRMVDYGNSMERGGITEYLIKWHKEIEPFFCKT